MIKSQKEEFNEYALNKEEKLEEMKFNIFKEVADLQAYKNQEEKYYVQQEQPEEIGYEITVNYYEMFWKSLAVNQMMVSQIQELSRTNIQFQHKLQKLTKSVDQYFSVSNPKTKIKKKNRRTNNLVLKLFTCPYKNCFKSYGYQRSLDLHIKIKHNQSNTLKNPTVTKSLSTDTISQILNQELS